MCFDTGNDVMSTESQSVSKHLSPIKKPRRRSFLDAIPWCLLALTVAGSCGAWYWAFDLCAHFRWYYFVIGVVWALAIWKQVRSKTMCCLLAAILWNGCLLLPYYVPASQSEIREGAATVSIISLNVFTANPNKSAVLAYLREQQADLIVVMEVDHRWEKALDELKDVYPHTLIQSREDNFGIGLLSRWPLKDERLVKLAGTNVPNVVATIACNDVEFRIVGTHPLPPIGAGYTHERNAQLRDVAELAQQSQLPCIVAGDFNATPWSSAFRDFAIRSHLRDSALGRGVQGSWNAKSPLIRIPIDHVFVPRNVHVVRRGLGRDVGSDHFPVEITLSMNPPE